MSQDLLPAADVRWDLLVEAVRYVQRVRAMGMAPSAYAKALREPVHFIYELRHNRNKYKAAEWRSVASIGVEPGGRRLVYDHAIPFKMIETALLSLDPVTPESVADVLGRLDVVCVITSGEDALLKKRGLAKRMPDSWKNGADPLARYAAVGIEVTRNG